MLFEHRLSYALYGRSVDGCITMSEQVPPCFGNRKAHEIGAP